MKKHLVMYLNNDQIMVLDANTHSAVILNLFMISVIGLGKCRAEALNLNPSSVLWTPSPSGRRIDMSGRKPQIPLHYDSPSDCFGAGRKIKMNG